MRELKKNKMMVDEQQISCATGMSGATPALAGGAREATRSVHGNPSG
jgi:hypothetical protein